VRGAGEEALQDEIERARRSDSPLVLAFVDVDGLREVNNREGHTVGDALLQSVVLAIRSKIRSYEPVVRFGGDEFVCAVADLDLEQAGERFASIQDSLAESSPGSAISVGLAELREDDTLANLIERADAALLDARASRDGAAG
jgi:diguanylate cyclase (GGDEF)-like protein